MTPLKDCRDQEVSVGDFVIYVVQGNRNAGIEFGYIYSINDKRATRVGHHDGKEYTTGDIAVKIQHSDPEGNRQNTTVVDVEGHWAADVPQRAIDYDNAGYGIRDKIMTWQEYWAIREEYWIATTTKDSGKPSTTLIRCSGGKDHRLLLTKPF